MNQILKAGLLGLVSGLLAVFLTSPDDNQFYILSSELRFLFPGLIFGLCMAFLVPTIKNKVIIVFFSVIGYVAALFTPLFMLPAISEYFFGTLDFLFVPLGGFIGAFILSLGFVFAGQFKIKDLIAVVILSAIISSLIPLTSSRLPDVHILFPVWQAVIALYIGYALSKKPEIKNQY